MPLIRLLALPSLQFGSFVAESWAAVRRDPAYSDVPHLDPSLRTIGEAVLDRSFSLGMNLLTGVPSAQMLRGARRNALAAQQFIRDNGWLEDPHGFHSTPPPVEEWEESPGRWLIGRRRIDYLNVRFPSEYAAPEGMPGAERWQAFENNQTAHAYVLEHADGPRPWLVCVHGFGMGTPSANFSGFNVGRLHKELGFNLAFPCLPLHGPRAAGRMSGGDLISPDYLNIVHAFAQGVFDVRRTISWVRERGATGIGLYGVSLGGYTSALVSAFEPDLACVVAGVPPVDFPGVARDNEPWIVRNADPEVHVDWQVVRELTHVVSPMAFTPAIPRERRFIYAGLADRVVRPDQARALWRHWGRPEIHWYPGGHVMGQFKTSIFDFVEAASRSSGLLTS